MNCTMGTIFIFPKYGNVILIQIWWHLKKKLIYSHSFSQESAQSSNASELVLYGIFSSISYIRI